MSTSWNRCSLTLEDGRRLVDNIITVKCFEDNGLLYNLLEQNGRGHILLIDGGGSVRRALIDADLARLAVQNEWEGLVVYGAVRQVRRP